MARLALWLLGITFFIAGLATQRVIACPMPTPVELSITTDKASYKSGESVNLTVELRNITTRPVQLVHPDYFGVTTIEVRDSSGTLVEPETFKGKRKSIERLLTLSPGEKKRHTFSALTAWTCCHGYRFELTRPGRYQVTLRIENPPENTDPPPGWTRDWRGTIAAAPVFIEVTAQ